MAGSGRFSRIVPKALGDREVFSFDDEEQYLHFHLEIWCTSGVHSNLLNVSLANSNSFLIR